MDKIDELISLLSEKNCENCLYSFVFNLDTICIDNSLQLNNSFDGMKKVEKLEICENWFERDEEAENIYNDIKCCYDLSELSKKISLMKLMIKIRQFNNNKAL